MLSASNPGLSRSPKAVAGATTALVLLTALNFVNYIDRYILPGVQEQVKHEFRISDEQIGSLTLWFMLAYMLASPLTGWLGDHFPRKPMIVIAALFWGSINLLTAFVHDYDSLNLRHAALGIGEASFGIFAPAMLSDFYPEDQRNRVLTIFNVAIPVGAALGYLIGGTVGEHFGWRTSFVVSAVPAILIALLIWAFLREPARGESAHPDVARSTPGQPHTGDQEQGSDSPHQTGERPAKGATRKARLEKHTILSLLRNPAYLTVVLGYAAVTFSLGGISWWMPSFLQRMDGRSQTSASFLMGAITVVAGLGGTVVGGWVAQKWSEHTPKALYLVPAISAALAVTPGLLCFFGPKPLVLPGLALAIFFIFLGTGPINAASVNSVRPEIRATALAGQLFAIHAFGDAISPRIIGAISDHSNLGVGLGSTLISLVVASIILFFGARFAPPLQPGAANASAAA